MQMLTFGLLLPLFHDRLLGGRHVVLSRIISTKSDNRIPFHGQYQIGEEGHPRRLFMAVHRKDAALLARLAFLQIFTHDHLLPIRLVTVN